jgi:hypothetical protein
MVLIGLSSVVTLIQLLLSLDMHPNSKVMHREENEVEN